MKDRKNFTKALHAFFADRGEVLWKMTPNCQDLIWKQSGRRRMDFEKVAETILRDKCDCQRQAALSGVKHICFVCEFTKALRANNAELEAELASLRAERITVEKMDTAVKDQIDRLEAQNTALVAERDKLKEAVRGLVEALEFYSDGENWHSRTDGMRQFACVDPRDEEYRPLTKDNFSIKRGGKIAIEALTRFREVCEWK